MTKQEILDAFSDINYAYNNSSKHETLSHMLDELLEEQEAVKPKLVGVNTWICGKCEALLGWEDFSRSGLELVEYKFCPECGRKVKWDDKRRSNNPKSSGAYRKLENHEGRR